MNYDINKQSVELVVRSVDKANKDKPVEFDDPVAIKKDMMVMAGKAAGICYMPDDYFSEGINNEAKSAKRALFNAGSGHYSVFEHTHLTFIIKTPKIMAMVLNATKLYSTSEKSARYTKMEAQSELEATLYNKWLGIFKKLLSAYNNNDDIKEKQIEKHAMENARYLLSIFTPTALEFTVPYGRAVLLVEWLRNFADDILFMNERNISDVRKNYNILYGPLFELSNDLANKLAHYVLPDNAKLLSNHKNMQIELFNNIRNVDILKNIFFKNGGFITYTDNVCDIDHSFKETYGNTYTSIYTASFAEFAQAERHRTISHLIEIYNENDTFDSYIPPIISYTPYHNEWIKDYNDLVASGVLPQSTLLKVVEFGRFEDFVLKCKERLCCRAQLEITNVTVAQVEKLYRHRANLSPINKEVLESMWDKSSNKVKTKCKFSDYSCKEPCDFIKSNYCRII